MPTIVGRPLARDLILCEAARVDVLRTPDERFADLPDFPYEPRYVEVEAGLRVAYVEAGPAAGPVVVLLHGEPTWGFLYRRVLRVLADAGIRAIAPDMIGFGRSDKPRTVTEHSYARHVAWMGEALFGVLDLREVVLVGQDWGGLLGLRLVAERPDRFAGVVASNTGLPTGLSRMPPVWERFRDVVAAAPVLDIPRLVASGCVRVPSPDVLAGYDAPFPAEEFKVGPRAMPTLVPNRPDDPGGIANRAAWERLARFDKPFLCAFSDSDPITAGADRPMRERIPGARGQRHVTIAGAGHFVQEDAGDELGRVVAEFALG
jgi:haloalkane dehalogenase